MKESMPTHSLEDARWEAGQMKKEKESGLVENYSEAEKRVEEYKGMIFMARLKYTFSVAQEESLRLAAMIEQKEAKNYSDAERIIQDEREEVYFAMLEEEGEALMAKEKLKFDALNDEPLSEKETEELDQMLKKIEADYPQEYKDFLRVSDDMMQATSHGKDYKSNALNRVMHQYLLDKIRDCQVKGDKDNDYLIEQSELNDILDKYLYNKK